MASVPKAEPATETTPKPSGKRERGIVKSVLSGDSIVVQEDKPSNQGPPAERVLALTALSAPRLSRGGKDDTKEEPFAWESREFVRKAVIGKKITFVVDHIPAGSSREYCTVYLPGTGGELGESLNNLIVSEGWATVFKSQIASKKNETKELLAQLEEQAIQAGKGMHAKDKDKKKVETPAPASQDSLFHQLKLKPLNAIVEQVRTGTSVRVTILPTRHTFQLLLSGCQAPGWRKKEGDAEPQPEPFAREAKYFVEQHVLQRDVQVTIDGIPSQGPQSGSHSAPQDKTYSYTGSIEYQGHDVTEELLKAGLAKYAPHTAVSRGAAAVPKLKAAEKNAKDNKRRLWANYEAKSADGSAGEANEFVGKVVSILNTGAILVVPEGGKEVQVNLSCIKVPKAPHPNDEATDAKEEDKQKVLKDRAERVWAVEGKELLRRRYLGQKVRVVLDYIRPAAPEKNFPEKKMYSVYHGDQNLAVVLVESGFASIAPSRQEERSADYEILLIAEEKAKKSHKGVHIPADKVPPRRINDLCITDSDDPKSRTNQIARTKQYLPGYRSAGPMKAVVEHVFSGARFKISVPKQACVFMFSLSGLRVPRRGENADSDVLSNLALLFSREKLHQTDVTIEVDDLDKGGNFVGSLYNNNKKNVAVFLLEAGLAAVHYPSAEKLKDSRELIAAEESAKQKKLGLWKNWDEEEEKRKLAAATEEAESSGIKSGGSQNVEVVVTEVNDGARFYVQVVGAEAAGLDELVSDLTKLSVSEGSGAPLTPKAGDLVRGQFGEDNQWYRAKVLEVQGGKFKLQYVDYGNTEVVPSSRIRLLPDNFRALPFQAQPAALAFVKPLKEDNEYARDAHQYLKELAAGKKLSGSIEYRDAGTLYLTLTDPSDGFNITVGLLRDGLARLERARRRHLSSPYFLKLREEEEKAKHKHAGIWRYGDVPDSDEDEGPSIRPQKGAAPAKGAAAAAAAGKEAPKKK